MMMANNDCGSHSCHFYWFFFLWNRVVISFWKKADSFNSDNFELEVLHEQVLRKSFLGLSLPVTGLFFLFIDSQSIVFWQHLENLGLFYLVLTVSLSSSFLTFIFWLSLIFIAFASIVGSFPFVFHIPFVLHPFFVLKSVPFFYFLHIIFLYYTFLSLFLFKSTFFFLLSFSFFPLLFSLSTVHLSFLVIPFFSSPFFYDLLLFSFHQFSFSGALPTFWPVLPLISFFIDRCLRDFFHMSFLFAFSILEFLRACLREFILFDYGG